MGIKTASDTGVSLSYQDLEWVEIAASHLLEWMPKTQVSAERWLNFFSHFSNSNLGRETYGLSYRKKN